ncbi:MAG: MBL fold metallo-hydrolase [Oscillospiraceae bacterium]
MRLLNMFSRQQIGKDTYVVTENYLPGHRCAIGVIVGAERVLVIDTGLGLAGDLRRYIESFVGTGKPIFCICTHGHTDCIGGAALFDEAYLAKADAGPVDPEFPVIQMRGWTNGAPGLEEYGCLFRKDVGQVEFKDLHEGDHFHLGGVHVGIMCIPGHTPGSVAVRVTREGVQTFTFCGDAFSAELNHLTNMNREDLLNYRDRLNKLTARIDAGEPCFSARSPVAISRDVGRDMARACEEVALGKIDQDAPFDFGFKKPDGGKRPDLRVHLTNNTYIVYNADLL